MWITYRIIECKQEMKKVLKNMRRSAVRNAYEAEIIYAKELNAIIRKFGETNDKGVCTLVGLMTKTKYVFKF